MKEAIISYKYFITEEDEDQILNVPEPDLIKDSDEEGAENAAEIDLNKKDEVKNNLYFCR